jgi:hypothetical protein
VTSPAPAAADPSPSSAAASPSENPSAAATTDGTAAAPEKTVKKAKVRKHRYRYARYRYWRHGFIIPPPQYWFRPWPRYRAYRGHRRVYAGFPFFFRARW